jgi:AraC-like DNA-binding protein
MAMAMTTAKDFPLEPGWRLVLDGLGVHPADLLRRAELPEDLFSRREPSLSTAEYFRFWHALEGLVDDLRFPLAVVEAVTAEAFMPALFAALCSRNLRTAAQRLSTYKRLIAPMRLHVAESDEALTLTFQWLDRTVRPPPSLMAVELAFLVHMTRMGTREAIAPLRVTALEPLAPADAFEGYFGVPVEAGERCSVTFRRVDAERAFLTANESIWRTFEPELRRRLTELDASASTAERVRSLLLESLPSGQTSMEEIAARLGVSKRTLQRRLGREATTYQAVVAGVREELARHYLTRTELSNAEISFLLGFEDPNSFFRAFRDWTGSTPEATRRAALP